MGNAFPRRILRATTAVVKRNVAKLRCSYPAVTSSVRDSGHLLFANKIAHWARGFWPFRFTCGTPVAERAILAFLKRTRRAERLPYLSRATQKRCHVVHQSRVSRLCRVDHFPGLRQGVLDQASETIWPSLSPWPDSSSPRRKHLRHIEQEHLEDICKVGEGIRYSHLRTSSLHTTT